MTQPTSRPAVPRISPRERGLALAAGVGVGTVLAGALFARRSLRSGSVLDRPFRRQLTRRTPRPRPGSALARALAVAAMPAEKTVYLPVTALAVARRRDAWQALPLGAALLAAHGAHSLVRRVVARRRPLHAHLVGKHSPSFPSGHATRASAAAVAIGWALVREDVARPRIVVPVALAVPAIVGASRAYADVHWATDVIGGWGLGGAVGAIAALCYEELRRHADR